MEYPVVVKRIAKWLLSIILVGFVILAGVVLCILSFQNDIFSDVSDCGVIFGAAVWRDDRPSHALYDRVMAGRDLYEKKQVDCLVLSGGPSTYGAHEVDVMKKILLEHSIPEEILVYDYRGISTEATLDNLPGKDRSYVMISNDFHLARINIMAWKKGFSNVSTHAAGYQYGRYKKETWFTVREIVGIMYTFLFVWG